MRHRLVLTFEALSDDISADDILTTVLAHRPAPAGPTRAAFPTSTSTPERILQRLDWRVVHWPRRAAPGRLREPVPGKGSTSPTCASTTGDDVRYIDWNVTARMDEPYLREYTEDRELSAWFLLDLSPSVDFGTAEADRQKRTVLTDFVTTLARLLTRRGNRVGAVLYGDRVERTIPAGSGRIQVLRIIDALLRQPRHPVAPFTDLRPLLDAGHKAIKRRSLVFVISDFISEPGWEKSLELWRVGTRSSRSGWSIRARSPCPTSDRSSCRTPRPASRSTSTPATGVPPAVRGGRGRARAAIDRRVSDAPASRP
jgi:uncharacterized protein (DUF58 family)